MSLPTKKWLLGCGIGCGGLVVLVIVGVVGSSFVFMGKFREAIADREILDERHGEQAAFIPPLDGAVAPERLQAFLTVRSAVMEVCAEFEATALHFQHMDQLEEDTPKREVLVEVMKLSGDVFKMVPRLGDFFHARNTTLLAVDMGLGEYTYIYVLAYGERLGTGGVEEGESFFGDTVQNQRIPGVLGQMLRNQLAAVVAAEAAGEELGEWRQRLEAEIERLDAEPDRLPWQDGLPPAIAASLAPFRDPLDDLFCTATVGLELNRNRQEGLSIHGE
jgi:hypothetical protein